jgi:hypothetical protein
MYIANSNIISEDLEVISTQAIRVPYRWADRQGLSVKKVWWVDENWEVQPRISVETFKPADLSGKEVLLDKTLERWN